MLSNRRRSIGARRSVFPHCQQTVLVDREPLQEIVPSTLLGICQFGFRLRQTYLEVAHSGCSPNHLITTDVGSLCAAGGVSHPFSLSARTTNIAKARGYNGGSHGYNRVNGTH